MQKWIYFVQSNCKDSQKEREYIQWYQTMHLPDLLESPGFVHAAFYQSTNPGKGEAKFLAAYQIESDDIEQTFTTRDPASRIRHDPGRSSNLLQVVSRSLYQEVPCPP